MALDQLGIRQQLEMTGNAGLRLTEDVGEFGHRQFGFVQQGEQAQARVLSGSLQAIEERGIGKRPGLACGDI